MSHDSLCGQRIGLRRADERVLIKIPRREVATSQGKRPLAGVSDVRNSASAQVANARTTVKPKHLYFSLLPSVFSTAKRTSSEVRIVIGPNSTEVTRGLPPLFVSPAIAPVRYIHISSSSSRSIFRVDSTGPRPTLANWANWLAWRSRHHRCALDQQSSIAFQTRPLAQKRCRSRSLQFPPRRRQSWKQTRQIQKRRQRQFETYA